MFAPGNTAQSRSDRTRRPCALGKFTRPRPIGALARSRLFRTLDEARRHPAVWVAGLPGAGKTTLVSTYVAQRRLRTIWYRLHGDDADPATFFHYFALAVEATAPGSPSAALPRLTPEYRHDLPAFSQCFFERVYQRLHAPCVIVLDNYQEVGPDAPLHEVMRAALESLHAGINVIAVSRGALPCAFACLQARGTIALVGAEELKLTAEECSDIARLRGIHIEEPALQQLYERTQGWTAGVVLALEQKAPLGSAAALPAQATPQVLFDYFASEIFERMPRAAQELLPQAAFLPSAAVQRVVELTSVPDAAQVLEDLSRSNYFTLKLAQAHGSPPLYQFHPLFREFLLRRAEETLEPPALAKLREKAAALLEADGESAEAVALLLMAQKWEEALHVVLAHANEMLEQGRGQMLETWLRALPMALREESPWALYWLGMCRLVFDPNEAREHFKHAFALFEREGDTAGLFNAWASIIDTFVHERGEIAAIDHWIGVLDELLIRYPGRTNPQIEARVAGSMFTALMYRQPHRSDLPHWAERVRSIFHETSNLDTQITLGNKLMHYFRFWRGDAANPRPLIETIRQRAQASEVDPLAKIAWCAMEAGYHLHMGDNEACVRLVNQGLDTARQAGARFMSSQLESHGVVGSLLAGDFRTAERFLKNLSAERSGGRPLFAARYHYLAFLIAFVRKDTSHAVASAREAVALGDLTGAPLGQTMYRLALAHALFSCGQKRESLVYLAQARRIARRACIANIEYSCLATTAYFLLERGKRRLAAPLLRKALAIGKRNRYIFRAYWSPEMLTRLAVGALEQHIEVEYVQRLIRRFKLPPAREALHLEHWPFAVRIHTLGRFTVLIDGKPLEFAGKAQCRPLELLMALVACGGRDLSERQLTEAVWPDAEGDAAHQACAVALHRLRKLLRCDEAINVQGNHFSLDPRHVWVDVWAFERSLDADEERPVGVHRQSESDRAVALYQGPFLAKHPHLTWAIPLRERLRAKFMRHLAARGRVLYEKGELSAAVALFEKGLYVDPLAEEFYRQLMVCYQAMDLRAKAISAYQRCEKALAATLGLAPAPKTVAVYQALQR